MKFHIDSPFLIILLFFISFFISLYTYRKHFSNPKFSRNILYSLFFLRFIAFFLVFFLLLNPVVQLIDKEYKKPKILFFQDNSSSLLAGKDSSFYKQEYPKIIDNFLSDISNKYEISLFSFGEKVRDSLFYNYSDKSTNISDVFNFVENNFYKENISHVIVASDGSFNIGYNPEYIDFNFMFPINTILLGDKEERSDIKIIDIDHKKNINLGADFSFDLSLSYNNIKNNNIIVDVYNNKELVRTDNIKLPLDDNFYKINLNFNAENSGINNYTFDIKSQNNEENLSNNVYSTFVNVIEKRKKILLIYELLHPDINAIAQSCYDNSYVEIDIVYLDDFDKDVLSFYDLILFYQVTSSLDLSNNINKPCLHFMGSSFIDFKHVFFKGLLKEEILNNNNLNYSNKGDVFLDLNRDFKSYKLDNVIVNYLDLLPPLFSSKNSFVLNDNFNVLFKEKSNDNPLLFFVDKNQNQSGFVLGEGFWRWRQYLYNQTKTHDIFNFFINDIFQFLVFSSTESDIKLNFKSNYYENENILVKAQVYNDLLQLNNDNSLKLTIKGKSGDFVYSFSKISDYYNLDLGKFLPGYYDYIVSLQEEDDTLYTKGGFVVHPFVLEDFNTKANHDLLKFISRENNGVFVEIDNLYSLKDSINSFISPNIEVINKKNVGLIHFKLIFFVILLSLLIEWFLRRYNSLK